MELKKGDGQRAGARPPAGSVIFRCFAYDYGMNTTSFGLLRQHGFKVPVFRPRLRGGGVEIKPRGSFSFQRPGDPWRSITPVHAHE